jgi:hypothetical protein
MPNSLWCCSINRLAFDNAILSGNTDVELRAVEFPEFNLKFNGKGYKAGVGAESAHQEEAMEAVAAIYSDAKLSNALVYGTEGESYQIENGLAVRPGEYGIVGEE